MLRYCVLFGLASSTVWSQTTGKISGRVYDAATNQPLAGANVLIPELQTGTATDLNGNFAIMRLYPGKYTVRIVYIGYAPMTIRDVRVTIDHTTFLDIPLNIQEIALQEVVVTAPKPIVEKDKTFSSTTLESEDIKNMPTEGLRNVLDLDPSIMRNPNGTFSLRGGGSFDINFMIDGVTQENSNTGVPGTNYMGERANTSWKYDFNPLGVKQMELISGGFSAEYGNAQSGVVKIVTKEGSAKFQGDVRLEYRAPGLYHFGDYLYNRNTIEWQKWGNFQNWLTWRDQNNPAISDDSLNIYYYQKWLATHTPSDQNLLGVYDYRQGSYWRLLFGLGGPIGKIPGWTFFLSGENRVKPTRLPTYEKFNRYQNINLTSVMRISNALRLRSMVQYQHSLSGIFSGSDDIRWASPVGNVSFNTGKQKYLLTTVAPKNEYSWIQSVVLTYIFQPQTFCEYTLSHTYELYTINTQPLSTTWQAPQGVWDEGFTRLVWDPSATLYNQDVRTHTWATKFDFTHQFSPQNHLKSGFQATQWQMHYSSVSSAYANAFIYKSGFAEYYRAKPWYVAFYIQDKMEYKGLIANLGLRAEGFNLNVAAPANPYSIFYPGTMGNQGNLGDTATISPKSHFAISPRLGLSFPIGERTAFRLQYGHFYAMPLFRHTISRSTWQGWIMYGNPDLGFRKTISYEFGIQHSLGGTHRLDVVAYYNDRTRQTINVRRHFDQGSYGRSVTDPYAATYLNTAYGATRGIEISLDKIAPGNWKYRLKYALSRSSAGSYGPSEIWALDDPNRPFDMRPFIQRANDNITADDKTHSFSAYVAYYFPAKAGLTLFGLYPLANTTITITYTLRSGIPFTYVTTYDEFFDVQNNRRYPLEYQTDLNLTRIVKLSQTELSLSLRLLNLFNNKWLTPFDPTVEQDDLKLWVGQGLTWDNPAHPNNKYNFHRVYRNIPREIYFSCGVGF